MPYSTAEKLYPLFDSWEEQPIDDEMIFNITQDKGEIIKDIDSVSKYLSTIYDLKSITKGIVADYCLRNGYPKNYVEPIYNSLKSRLLKLTPRKVVPKNVELKKPYTLRK
jgi:hypothetical protein